MEERLKSRTLVPHEHGAYGQLAMPLLTALAIGRPGIGAFALALATLFAFVAHEPLLVLLGQRGPRAREVDGPRARRLLVVLGVAAAVTGLAGFVASPASARVALALPVLLAAVVAWLVRRRLEKTVLGEVSVATALSSCGLAVALAGGAPRAEALTCWLTWILGFAAATFAVQGVLTRARTRGERDPGPIAAAVTVALVALAFALARGAGLPVAAPLALVPMALLSLAVSVFRVSAKRLREVGWMMVGASLLTLAVLVVGLR